MGVARKGKPPLDPFLFARALQLQRQAWRREGKALLSIADVPVGAHRHGNTGSIVRTAGVACRMGSWFGMPNTCLPRSLVACRLLREHGIDAHVVFGVRRGKPDLDGHCWIEGEGLPHAPHLREEFDEVMTVPPAKEGASK
jgi:hypothetical protein